MWRVIQGFLLFTKNKRSVSVFPGGKAREMDNTTDVTDSERFFFSVGLSPLTSGSGRLRKRTSGATRDFRLLVLSWGTLATACEGLWLSGRKVCVGGRGWWLRFGGYLYVNRWKLSFLMNGCFGVENISLYRYQSYSSCLFINYDMV